MTRCVDLTYSRPALSAVCAWLVMALCAVSGTAASQTAVTTKEPKSWCTAQETNVFTCRTGKKTVSVCVSPDASANKGSLHYRFGQLSGGLQPEMTLPEKATPPRLTATGETATYAGGGGSWLRFRKGSYAYGWYTGIGAGTHEPLAAAGCGRRTQGADANLPCPAMDADELDRDWYTAMGIQVDEQDFTSQPRKVMFQASPALYPIEQFAPDFNPFPDAVIIHKTGFKAVAGQLDHVVRVRSRPSRSCSSLRSCSPKVGWII